MKEKVKREKINVFFALVWFFFFRSGFFIHEQKLVKKVFSGFLLSSVILKSVSERWFSVSSVTCIFV